MRDFPGFGLWHSRDGGGGIIKRSWFELSSLVELSRRVVNHICGKCIFARRIPHIGIKRLLEFPKAKYLLIQ